MQVLPLDVSAYVAIHMELQELSTLTCTKRFPIKYVKVMQKLRHKGRSPVHIVEEQRQVHPKSEKNHNMKGARGEALFLTWAYRTT